MLLVRIIYFLFLIFLLVVLLPFLIAISLAVLILNGPPLLYRQKRLGKDKQPFVLYKFRTMQPDAEKLQPTLRQLNEAKGPVFKIFNDPRFTGVGKFLSHTGLDELPQIINIIKGDMAIIGPRPLPIAEAARLTRWQQQRHKLKPGIISPWIVNGYHSRSFVDWMKSDVEYVRSKSVATDLNLFIKACGTFLHLLSKEIERKKTYLLRKFT